MRFRFMAADSELDQWISLMCDSLDTINAELKRLENPNKESVQNFNKGASFKARIYCLLKSNMQIWLCKLYVQQ